MLFWYFVHLRVKDKVFKNRCLVSLSQNENGGVSQHRVLHNDSGHRHVWQHPCLWNDQWQLLQVRLSFMICTQPIYNFFNHLVLSIIFYVSLEPLPTVEPITQLFRTITTRGTESTSARCTESTSTRSAGVTVSSLRRPSMPDGQHGTRWSLNTPPGASKDDQEMFLHWRWCSSWLGFDLLLMNCCPSRTF